MSALLVCDTSIRRDDDGRYCLNDLHRAAGSEKRHGPSYWLANQQTKELVAELTPTGNPVVTREGATGGTFVAKELVYAYAMWISPSFHIKVIRAYDAQFTAARRDPADDNELSTVDDRRPLYHDAIDIALNHGLSIPRAYRALNCFAGVKAFRHMTKRHVKESGGFASRLLSGDATQNDFRRVEVNRAELAGEEPQLALITAAIPLIHGGRK